MTAHLLPIGTPPTVAYRPGQVAYVPGMGWWAVTPDAVMVTLTHVTEHASALISATCDGWVIARNAWERCR